jgi:hypothetical protein
VVLFKPFEDADVGSAERAAAFEGDTYFGTARGRGLCFRDGRGGLLRRRRRLLREAGTRKADSEKRGQ